MRILLIAVIGALSASNASSADQSAVAQAADQIRVGEQMVRVLSDLPPQQASEIKKKLKIAGIDLDELKQKFQGGLTPPQVISIQRIVADEIKPVPLVNGRLSPMFSQKATGFHRELTKAEQAAMEGFAKSVGRIEVRYGTSSQRLGTGFVVAGGAVATNCHVVDAIEQVSAANAALKPQAFVVFGGSGKNDPERSFALTASITRPSTIALDVAVIGLAHPATGAIPDPLPASEVGVTASANAPFFIGLLGYPSFVDAKLSFKDLLEKLLSKNAPPGLVYTAGAVLDVRQTYTFNSLYHVANTAPGSSGSPVISLDRMKVVGVHACCSAEGPVQVAVKASSCAQFKENRNFRNVAISVEAALADLGLKPFFLPPSAFVAGSRPR